MVWFYLSDVLGRCASLLVVVTFKRIGLSNPLLLRVAMDLYFALLAVSK